MATRDGEAMIVNLNLVAGLSLDRQRKSGASAGRPRFAEGRTNS
jgi:hypothetical protein